MIRENILGYTPITFLLITVKALIKSRDNWPYSTITVMGSTIHIEQDIW
jgi:hypothetical protein